AEAKGTVIIRYVDSASGKIIREEVVVGEKGITKTVEPKKAIMIPGTTTKAIPPVPAGPGAPIDRLEKMLEGVIKELSGLKKQVGRPGEGGRGLGGGGFGRARESK